MTLYARMRFTDIGSGPSGGDPGTATDFDFALPVECATTPSGSVGLLLGEHLGRRGHARFGSGETGAPSFSDFPTARTILPRRCPREQRRRDWPRRACVCPVSNSGAPPTVVLGALTIGLCFWCRLHSPHYQERTERSSSRALEAGATGRDFLGELDGSALTNLSMRPTAVDTDGTWSPDGSKIAFVSDPDGPGGASVDLRDERGWKRR